MQNTIEEEVAILKGDIGKIKARNQKVEADKAWETSKTRATFIACMTFVLVYTLTELSGGERPLANAAIGVLGFWVSTETYGILRNWWLKKKI